MMKNMIVFLVLLAAALAAVQASEVVALTDTDYASQLGSGKWFLKLYAPWCGHCKKLAPTWDDLAGSVQTGKVAKVDCTVEKVAAKAFGVRGYPTLKIVDGGRVYDYKGTRQLDILKEYFDTEGYKGEPSVPLADLLAGGQGGAGAGAAELPADGLVARSAGSEVVELTDDTLGEWAARGEPLFVKFFAPWCGHCQRLAPVWEELAARLQGKVHVAKLDCTVHKWACGQFGVRGYPTLVLLRGGHAVPFAGADRTLDELEGFALDGYRRAGDRKPVPSLVRRAEGAPSKVVELDDASFDRVAVQGSAPALVMFYAPWCGHCKRAMPDYEELAHEVAGGGTVVARVNGDSEKVLLQRFGVRGFPTFKLFRDGNVYDYSGERTVAAFKEFLAGGYTKETAREQARPMPPLEKAFQTWAIRIAAALPQYAWMGDFDSWVKDNLASAFFAVCFVSAAIGNLMGFVSAVIMYKLYARFARPARAPRPAQPQQAKKPAAKNAAKAPPKEKKDE